MERCDGQSMLRAVRSFCHCRTTLNGVCVCVCVCVWVWGVGGGVRGGGTHAYLRDFLFVRQSGV
jgi:hypothetical protein